jgi:hypothetical protein
VNAETHYPTVANETGRLTYYISGPMRGLPHFGFPAFDAARDFLRAIGHNAVSPADHDRQVNPGVEDSPGFAHGIPAPDGPSFADLIGWDLRFIASFECDAVLFLPGWEKSKGAAYERTVAEACSKRIFYFDPEGPSMYEERPTTLIGVSGYAQAGKDSIGGILCDAWGFERVGFADALKAVLRDLDPRVEVTNPPRPGEGGWVMESVMTKWIVDNGPGWEWLKANTVARDYLQRLGVAVREHVDPDAWVNAALRGLKPGGAYVITDLRFPNEYEAIRERGGQVWRVTRPGTAPVNAHVSETALDGHEFDETIVNDGTLADLAVRVGEALHLA